MYLEYKNEQQNQKTNDNPPIQCKLREIKWFIKNIYTKKLGNTFYEAYNELAFKLNTKRKYAYKYIALIAERILDICKENRWETINPVIAELIIDSLIVKIALAKNQRKRHKK